MASKFRDVRYRNLIIKWNNTCDIIVSKIE